MRKDDMLTAANSKFGKNFMCKLCLEVRKQSFTSVSQIIKYLEAAVLQVQSLLDMSIVQSQLDVWITTS
jgi:hypothetical protein